jgi:hypothetical protein
MWKKTVIYIFDPLDWNHFFFLRLGCRWGGYRKNNNNNNILVPCICFGSCLGGIRTTLPIIIRCGTGSGFSSEFGGNSHLFVYPLNKNTSSSSPGHTHTHTQPICDGYYYSWDIATAIYTRMLLLLLLSDYSARGFVYE